MSNRENIAATLKHVYGFDEQIIEQLFILSTELEMPIQQIIGMITTDAITANPLTWCNQSYVTAQTLH